MLRLVFVCAAAASLAACGTITRGSTETVTFNSEPIGAEVRTSLGSGCATTPCSLEIPRKSEFTAVFSAPGYAEQQIAVTTKVSGGGGASMAGNVLFGGVIGVGVDAANGTTLDHDPNPVYARLEPVRPEAGHARRKPRAKRAPAA